jgi:hypothetical protein
MNRPEKCLTVEEARKLQDKWKKTRGKEIEHQQGYQDTREFCYSVKELREYLDYVEDKSKEQGFENPGIRIYFGAYPKTNKKKSYSTIFLAPTKENTGEFEDGKEIFGENNYEIDPLNTVTGGWPPKNY